MNRPLIGILLLGALAGCSRKEDAGASQHFSEPAGADRHRAGQAGATPPARRTLAYSHSLAVDVTEEKVTPTFEAGQAACRAMTVELCTVLNAQLNGPETGQPDRAHLAASATLTMRALPPAIPKLIAAFATRGEVTRQSTRAEELSGPLEDQAKKLALLKDYRERLEALRGRAANDIDGLIKINHELAQVQGELEAAAGKQAELQQRVDTELLEVTIQSQRHQSFWRPIAQSLGEFSASLSLGTASAISGAAWLLPWSILLGFFAWVGRKLWRRRK